ncbi:hypothetical protein [Bacillus phage FI_KG-Lek]|nr:hypothetical protein [Bacillus phage FI_KG-Lek]
MRNIDTKRRKRSRIRIDTTTDSNGTKRVRLSIGQRHGKG